MVLGAGFASWFAGTESRPLLARICATALVTGLVVRLAVPCVWLSGGEVMRLSGLARLGSPLYWAGIAVMAVCLGVLWKNRTIPTWLPILALLGELAGRAAFFSETVHTAINMGNPYWLDQGGVRVAAPPYLIKFSPLRYTPKKKGSSTLDVEIRTLFSGHAVEDGFSASAAQSSPVRSSLVPGVGVRHTWMTVAHRCGWA